MNFRGSAQVRPRPSSDAGFQHVFRGVALAHVLDHALEDANQHVVLGLQLGAGDHGARARHDARLVVAELEQQFQRVDAAAEPAAAEPIEHRVPLRRHGVADREHVRVAEVHVDVAIGVRFEQVAVLDLLCAPTLVLPVV